MTSCILAAIKEILVRKSAIPLSNDTGQKTVVVATDVDDQLIEDIKEISILTFNLTSQLT